jgi:hypothetical protein
MTGPRFHGLRHFFVSQFIANGETAAYVGDQIGHSPFHRFLNPAETSPTKSRNIDARTPGGFSAILTHERLLVF